MEDNREAILANFQAVTAIDDIAQAIYILESSNWDLQAAIHLALQEDNDLAPSVPTASASTINFGSQIQNVPIYEPVPIDADIPYPIPYDLMSFTPFNDSTGPSTSSSFPERNNFLSKVPQELAFHIHFNDQVNKIVLSSNLTVGDLKTRIYEKTRVPVCRQQIRGWPQAIDKEASKSATVLKNLHLSRDTNLFLRDISEDGIEDSDVMFVSDEPQSYRLDIEFVDENRTISLNFLGDKTIQDVKNGIYAVTEVPVRYQKWKGWPSQASNSTRLSDSGINLVQKFELSRESSENNLSNNQSQVIDSDSSEAEEFEDATEDLNADDIFSEELVTPGRMIKHLIEDHVDDEIIGCLQFIENYRERYGPGPQFYEGSLENAVKTACAKQAKDRKLLAIYLHHDRSVSSNLFCVQILNNENMIRLLTENFVIYGWDLTCESNKNMFLSSMTACVGDAASLQIRNTPVIQLPAIIIIRKQRSSVEVENVIHGNVSLDELYIQLMRNADDYKEQLKGEIREEEERFAREMVKMEQDAAYRESLEADRAKEMAKQQKEQMIAIERKRLESEHAEAEAKKEAIRKEAENTLPPEPDSSCLEVTKIRFRKPTGEFIERKFTQDTKLQILLNFSTANGFPVSDYKIISSFPRRDLTSIDPHETLKSLKLFPQETVMLEERH